MIYFFSFVIRYEAFSSRLAAIRRCLDAFLRLRINTLKFDALMIFLCGLSNISYLGLYIVSQLFVMIGAQFTIMVSDNRVDKTFSLER